ncbi:MAG: APC family permease [Ktedonobacteraceae bacterium]
MAQEVKVIPESQGDEHSHEGNLLGPLLCWAVVFADIGTSVYYTPGILYGSVGKLAGFFVFLTMTVFVLLTLKYAEVTHRFPQGGGVVTVAAQAINHWVGALGGMFILVDYFLTSAISSISGIQYFSVVIPAIGPSITLPGGASIQPIILLITISVLILLGILNWVGVSESAKVSLVGAVIAFASDIAILITVFTHMSFTTFLSLFPAMFAHETLTPASILIGFAGSFLAFSGLESISQLSPVMKTPRKKVAGIALLLVVLTIGITSPILTMLSTVLQPHQAANSVLSTQLISLLGGKFGGYVLQTEVAISAGALLVFASNTAIIGSYHVFIALARMEFFPTFVLQRNKLRGTPHYSIALATGIPIVVLIVVLGNINILGDMYAFGLLGAFTLTCLGLDLVRYRERKAAREAASAMALQVASPSSNGHGLITPGTAFDDVLPTQSEQQKQVASTSLSPHSTTIAKDASIAPVATGKPSVWSNIEFWLGILTTILVFVAWSTNLVAKPLATAFGGTVAGIGMLVAYFNYRRNRQAGRVPVMTTGVEGQLPGSILAILTAINGHNDAVIKTAINNADGHPVVFLYIGENTGKKVRTPTMFEVVDPYLDDAKAKEYFGKAEHLAQQAKINRRFVYRMQEPGAIARVWQIVHPHDTVVAAENAPSVENINPDRVRYELTTNGKVAHLLKTW